LFVADLITYCTLTNLIPKLHYKGFEFGNGSFPNSNCVQNAKNVPKPSARMLAHVLLEKKWRIVLCILFIYLLIFGWGEESRVMSVLPFFCFVIKRKIMFLVVFISEQPESHSSTLVRRKTVTNLNCCDSFSDLNSLNADFCNCAKTEPKYKDQIIQTDSEHLHSVTAHEFSFVQVQQDTENNSKTKQHSNSENILKRYGNSENASKTNGNTETPVPKPRRMRLNRRRKPLPEVDDVFENVEINQKTNEEDSSECFFLSVMKPEEVMIQTEKLSQTPPYQCQKNYIPKNELSLLLKIAPDQLKNTERKLSSPPKESALLDVLSKWLLGPEKELTKGANIPSKGEIGPWAWSETSF